MENILSLYTQLWMDDVITANVQSSYSAVHTFNRAVQAHVTRRQINKITNLHITTILYKTKQ